MRVLCVTYRFCDDHFDHVLRVRVLADVEPGVAVAADHQLVRRRVVGDALLRRQQHVRVVTSLEHAAEGSHASSTESDYNGLLCQ